MWPAITAVVARAAGDASHRCVSKALRCSLAVGLLLLARGAAEPGEPRSCAGTVFTVAGPALLSDRLGEDAIRLEEATVAIRSGCDEAPVATYRTREGDTVWRAQLSHCAVAAESVSLWLRVRDDCSKLVGRIALLPARKIRLFEAVRTSARAVAWPPACTCEPLEEAVCAENAAAACP